jgi:TusA-related sulfurtransferase
MSTTVDARGLSCPQPVLMTMDEMKKVNKGKIMILVDTNASKENVSRSAESQGWQVKEEKMEGSGYKITIERD